MRLQWHLGSDVQGLETRSSRHLAVQGREIGSPMHPEAIFKAWTSDIQGIGILTFQGTGIRICFVWSDLGLGEAGVRGGMITVTAGGLGNMM